MTTSINSIPASDPVAAPEIQIPLAAPPPPKPPRLVSLDVFRGATIAAMVLVNNSPGPKYWPLDHVEWNGWTPTDLIFPFFLFIVGVATPFSMARRTGGETRRQLLGHIWTRALSLFMLGELLTGIPSRLAPLPAGYGWITTLRIAVWAFCCLGIVLLLFPWKSRKISAVMPVAFFVLFYAIAFILHLVIQRAKTDAALAGFTFGNGLLDPTLLRIPGVLQRIGICYGVAASIGLFFGWRMVLVWAIAFMALYSVLMLKVPFGENHVVGSLTKEDNLSRRIDEWLFIREGRWHHAYSVYPDNEGVLSTLPAIATTLLGILTGVWLRTFRPAAERCSGLLVFGLFTLLLGLGLNDWLMPINKNIWTPSFTVFTAGMALLCLGTVFYFVDVLNHRAWAYPFKVYGMNAIAAFVLSGLLVRIGLLVKTPFVDNNGHFMSAWSYAQHFVRDGMTNLARTFQNSAIDMSWLASGENISLVFGISYVILILLLMWILYVFKIFLKV